MCAVVLGKNPGNLERSVRIRVYKGFMIGATDERPNEQQWDAFLVTFATAEKRVRYNNKINAEKWDAFLASFASAVRRASRIRGVSNEHRNEQPCKLRDKNSVSLIVYLSRVTFFSYILIKYTGGPIST